MPSKMFVLEHDEFVPIGFVNEDGLKLSGEDDYACDGTSCIPTNETFSFTVDFEPLEGAFRKLSDKLNALSGLIRFLVPAEHAKEVAKYARRVMYHRRLSRRNQLHPKRKPKGGR